MKYKTKVRQYLKFCPICQLQNVIKSQKVARRQSLNVFPTSRNWLPMADYFCVSMIQSRCPQVACLQPFALAVAKRTRLPCHCPCARMRHNHLCLISSKDFNIMSTLSVHQSTHLAAKNRFSRRFVLMQKGGSCKCRQNEFLFKNSVIST